MPILIGLCLWPSSALSQELVVPGQTPPPEIHEIELTYVGDQSVPKIIVRRRQPANPFVLSSYRPSDPHLPLATMPSAGNPIDLCQAQQTSMVPPLRVRLTRKGTSPCEFTWSLRTSNTRLDALSFHALRVRGRTSSPLLITLVAESADQRQSIAEVGRVAGRFDVEFPLAPIARQLDLRRLTQVKLLVEDDADVVLEECAWMNPAPSISPSPSVGFWYWDYRTAIRNPAGMLSACRQHHCRRLLLQMPDMRDPDEVWTAYAALFPATQAAGIELLALDGAPDMIDTPTILTDKVTRLLTLIGNSSLPGMQLDIEPYLLEGFPDDVTIFDRYLDTIERVKTTLGGRGRLSVVIPFWFTSTIHRNRPLAFTLIDRVDEVAVMSYRTDVEELATISEDTLRYGRLQDIPIWLAMETTRLLPERHVILQREDDPALANGILDPVRRMLTLGDIPAVEAHGQGGIGFRIHHDTTIQPEHLSFAGRTQREVRHAINRVFAKIHSPSFSGLLIHDLPGYLGLQE
ncbi:MAG: hypothetical protein E8D52_14745 [Nitrospira sp.]|nr:MAG: hypothetical protein E8D52_14745 [Nitrospira sp.]